MMNRINKAYNYIKTKYNQPIDLAIILGSGLGPLADEIENPVYINYQDIPDFPVSTAPGHIGRFVIGKVSNKTIIAMQGRFHYYEGYTMEDITLPVRIFSLLNIEKMIVTNACGGIREDLMPGQITLITDHISTNVPSPLRGPNLEAFGPRFKDMTEVYSKQGREIARQCAKRNNISIAEGIYMIFQGPMFETPAEIMFAKAIGADLAGMSTVPEAIVARHCGMQTLGISLVTNKAAGLGSQEITAEEVFEAAKNATRDLVVLVKDIIHEW